MQRTNQGFVFVIALALLVIAVIFSSMLLAYGMTSADRTRKELEMQLAQRSAELGMDAAVETITEKVTRSYFSDPIESFYWFGGDLDGDGWLATDTNPLAPHWTPDFTNCTGTGAGPCLLSFDPNAGNPHFLGIRDQALGSDNVSSFREFTIRGSYHPLVNPDPAGDDYHPLFNPQGDEGKFQAGGTLRIPTVEDPQTRWQRYLLKTGTLAEFNEGNLTGLYAVRAIDNAARIDLNGPSLLTARLLNSLLLMAGSSPGPVSAANPALGRNARGIEARSSISIPLAGGTSAMIRPLDSSVFFLLPSPGFQTLGADLFATTGGTPPKKIATTAQEEKNYFLQPPSHLDPDAIVIVKYRDSKLGGRFQSIPQLLEIRRADGSLIFPQNALDELQRLSEFLALENWRDSNTISCRNAEPITFGAGAMFPESLPWSPSSNWSMIPHYQESEPWQDIFPNGFFEGGELFEDRGLDNLSNAEEPSWPANRIDNVPDRSLDDFHPIWNPFFIRRFSAPGKRPFFIADSRYGVHAWSPFQSTDYSLHPLPNLRVGISSAQFPDIPRFNLDATEQNARLDLDPYSDLFTQTGTHEMLSESWGVRTLNTLVLGPPLDTGIDQIFGSASHPGIENQSPWQAHASEDHGDGFWAAPQTKGRLACQPSSPIWGMVHPAGTEGSAAVGLPIVPPYLRRLDPFPELGRTVQVALGTDLPQRFSGLYQNAADTQDSSFNPSQLLKPEFASYPFVNGIQLEPPSWAKANSNWFAEPGEPYEDNGRDRLPNTGDFGEGNGKWDSGEFFLDWGLDARPDKLEQAFSDPALTQVLSQCPMITGTTSAPRDLHQDNVRIVNGRYSGSEGDFRFNLLREPYLDLDRNGFRNPGGNSPTPVVTLGAPIFPNGFLDLNGNGLFDRGSFRESRSPINLNAATEELLSATLFQALVHPAKKRQDRFVLSRAVDFAPGTPSDTPTNEDLDWRTVVVEDPNNRILAADLDFAFAVARGLARAMFLRRLGLYVPDASSDPAKIGAGPFRSWQEFDEFANAILENPNESARFAATHPSSLHPYALDQSGNPLPNPFLLNTVQIHPGGSGYPSGETGVRKLILDRILVQANPNSRLKKNEPDSDMNPRQLDKSDFPFPSTEFCFGPTGVYEITVRGYCVTGTPAEFGNVQVVDANLAGSDEEPLSSKSVRAQTEITTTVKLFENLHLSTLADFENTKVSSRGVRISPNLVNPSSLSQDANAGIEELSSPSDQTDPFLLVRPQVIYADEDRGLLFCASQNSPLSSNNVISNPYDSQQDDLAGAIQVFTITPSEHTKSIQSFTQNNGQTDLVQTSSGVQHPIGLIRFDRGLASPAKIAAMYFDPHFPDPSRFLTGIRYLGRLYLLDDLSQSLRAIDLGIDAGGALFSEEVFFDSGSDLQYGGNFTGIQVIGVPQRREVLALLRNGSASIQVRAFRYAEGPNYPKRIALGTITLDHLESLGPATPIGSLAGAIGNHHAFVRIVCDPIQGYGYIAGTEVIGARLEARVYRFRSTAPFDFELLFPWTAGFLPPGYEFLTGLSNTANREVRGLEIDPDSQLLFLLWNNAGSQASEADQNGFGAYLAALPIGAAPYLLNPIVNPFPMELSLGNGSTAFPMDDTRPIFAASFALDPLQKSILIAPEEQICDANNPYADSKRALSLLSYFEDGLRQMDPLFVYNIWTDPNSFSGVSPNERPTPIELKSIPGRNLFLLSIPANQVTQSSARNCKTGPCPCAQIQNPPWEMSRSVRLLQVKGFGFRTESETPRWEDGSLTAKANALPLSANMNPQSPESRIHSRASFESGVFFSQPNYRGRDPNPIHPVSMRSLPTQTNAKMQFGGIHISNSLPTLQQACVDLDPLTPVMNGPQNGLRQEQKIVYPQDGFSTNRNLIKPKLPNALQNQENLENGWRILEGGTEFWIRFGDLSNFDPPSGRICIYENFSKAKADLSFLNSSGIEDFSDNPFLGDSISGSLIQKKCLFNILKAGEAFLGHPASFPIPPIGMTLSENQIASFSFCPDAIEIWAYDQIFLENIQGTAPNFTANLAYERRLAGPAGQYPGIYRPNFVAPWGIHRGSPWNGFTTQKRFIHPMAITDYEPIFDANGNGQRDLAEPYQDINNNFRYDMGEPFTDVDGNGSWSNADAFDDIDFDGQWDNSLPGIDLSNRMELQKYAQVRIQWNLPNSPISYHRFVPIWSRSVLTNNRQAAVRISTAAPVALQSSEWMRIGFASRVDFNPNVTFEPSNPASVNSALMQPSLNPSETVLRVWTSNGLAATNAPAFIQGPNQPKYNPSWLDFPEESEGFLAFTGFEDPFPGRLANWHMPNWGGTVVPGFSYTVDDIVFYERPDPVIQSANSPAAITTLRYEVGEDEWPVHGFGSPGNPSQSPYLTLPAEPFFDQDQNGLRNSSGTKRFWDFNANGKWDFVEPLALAGDALTQTILGTYAEPFSDENGNSNWDLGEPFARWSLAQSPNAGELYRENGLNPGHDASAPLFPAAGSTLTSGSMDWNGNGQYEASGCFIGKFPQTISKGSRIGSLSFTARRPRNPGEPEEQSRVSLDLELRATDGRFLGKWSGIDHLAADLNGVISVDESAIGLPIPTDAHLYYRANFFLPSPQCNPAQISRPTRSAVLDDLSITIVLPPQARARFGMETTHRVLVKAQLVQ